MERFSKASGDAHNTRRWHTTVMAVMWLSVEAARRAARSLCLRQAARGWRRWRQVHFTTCIPEQDRIRLLIFPGRHPSRRRDRANLEVPGPGSGTWYSATGAGQRLERRPWAWISSQCWRSLQQDPPPEMDDDRSRSVALLYESPGICRQASLTISFSRQRQSSPWLGYLALLGDNKREHLQLGILTTRHVSTLPDQGKPLLFSY